METNNNIPNITMTVIFEGSALNRNEKIGGNILSVKKLNVNGEEKTYLSKGAIRHYLFNTLVRAKKWKEAKIFPDGQVLQFDINADDILTCEELDVFGYMNTTYGQTRKTPLHITKAISLFPYEQDMGMYANHDLVRRAKEQGFLDETANPNPFNKEEHTSFYKITFTVDSDKLGVDKWIVPIVEIDESKRTITLKNVSQKEDNASDKTVEEAKDSNKNKKQKKASKNEIIRSITYKAKSDNVQNRFEVENGTIEILQLPNKRFRVTFELSQKIKQKRIQEVLTTIYNGLIAHTSSESNTIVPLFAIVADVRIPSPVFHPFIDVKKAENGNFEVTGIVDAINNDWLEGNLFIKRCERLKVPHYKKRDKLTEYNTFDLFWEAVNLKKSETYESPTN